jgi:NAD(P)-dependent dehydrogenase (short-subunit alcohol dehydrogenase family)
VKEAFAVTEEFGRLDVCVNNAAFLMKPQRNA